MDSAYKKPIPRLYYIDNIRLFIIICVVMHHLAVTYSGFGSWYYMEPSKIGALSSAWFTVYLAFQQAYFMGMMFLLAGYFIPGSFDFAHFSIYFILIKKASVSIL